MPASGVAARVVRWQRSHGRNDLPWQSDRDPYKVWLSEVMLQQTQVATVKGYFLRFTERFPDVQALAAADEDEVLGLWSGLGYYQRARNLQRCARIVVQSHGGQFPKEAAALATLPGIGRSTAAAIASICHGERVAILDGNVRRLLARVLGFSEDLGTAAAQRLLWTLAESLLPRRETARQMPRYTQGVMDLGATVCLPRQPRCDSCPLASLCVARREGRPDDYPRRTRATRRQSQVLWLLWARDERGGAWLARRPPRGIWGGLYCLPWFDSRDELLAAVPATARAGLVDLPVRRHALTHRELHLHAVRWQVPAGHAGPPGATRHAWPALRGLGLPAPVRAWFDQEGSQPNEVVG